MSSTAQAIPHLHEDGWHFDFHASLGPMANDKWFPYRVNTLDVGKRILDLIKELRKQPIVPRLAPAPVSPQVIWVGTPHGPR
jgi:hypothetical protein